MIFLSYICNMIRDKIFSIDTLKDAMKNSDKTELNLIRVLRGEISRLEDANKKLNEAEVVSLLKKMAENLKQFKTETSDKELVIIESMLPKQLSEHDLALIINTYTAEYNLTSIKDMGKIMGFLKENYVGTYDGGIANKIIKTILQ
jgi:uncharacterized protein YqeY